MTSASIPSRRTLNVQLGPSAAVEEADIADEYPDELLRRTRRTLRQQMPSRLRWSRMAAPPGQPPAAPPPPLEPSPPLAHLLANSAGSASLCQLVDFGETRDLIRRQREAAKQVAEVDSIVNHLSLDRENDTQSQRHMCGWATFRQQPNSQFKQYVFQSPGRIPVLPAADSDDAAASNPYHQRPHQNGLQRSRTTLGLVSGRPVARHSRPEPLGAAALRRSEFQASPLSRETTRASLVTTVGPRVFHGYSSSVAGSQQEYPDSLYGQFAHRKSKSFRLG